jgi:predicted neuraminidase
LRSARATPIRRLWLSAALAAVAVRAVAAPPGVVESRFVFESAPFASAHASTIVETRDGLLAAWFGGSGEGRPDVAIWLSRFDGSRWAAPAEVADGRQADGTRFPCWNPVLFQPSRGPLLLFYKVGPSPSRWWGLVRSSTDEGRTWSAALRLPPGILGPIRAKPVELPDGTVLAGSSTEDAGWVAHVERWTGADVSSPEAWQRSAPLNDARAFGAIQPTLLVHAPARVQALCRSRQGMITQAWSEDAGRTWTPMKATPLPNPSAGIDALRLADGRFLLAYNPSVSGREKLDVALSVDGVAWRRAVALEDAPGEYSYPALIQARDGRVHVTYTWRRQRIRHVVIDPAALPR